MGRFKLNKFDMWKITKRTIYGFAATAASLVTLYPNATTHILDKVLPISVASAAAQAIITLAKNFAWDDHSKEKE